MSLTNRYDREGQMFCKLDQQYDYRNTYQSSQSDVYHKSWAQMLRIVERANVVNTYVDSKLVCYDCDQLFPSDTADFNHDEDAGWEMDAEIVEAHGWCHSCWQAVVAEIEAEDSL